MTGYWLIITIVILFAVGGITFTYLFSKKAIVKRKLKKAISKNISQFLNGDIAKVIGKVEFVGDPLIAPLSSRECAYYYVLVEQKVSSGKNTRWKKIIEEEVAGNFVVRDGNDRAFVDTMKIKTYLVQDRNFNSGFMNDATDQLNTYLASHGHKSTGMLGLNKSVRYREGILEKDEMIAAVGKGEWKKAEDLNLPESFDRVLHISAAEHDSVYLSDDPKTLKVNVKDSSRPVEDKTVFTESRDSSERNSYSEGGNYRK